MMKYGLYLPNFGAFAKARKMAELAREAESAGWDGFFIWDHICRAWLTPMVDPWIALSAIAIATESIRIGALVTPLVRRRPWKVARETVSLDHLSCGRLVLGVGLGSSGGQDVEWGNFGEEMDLKKRGEMLDEGLEILSGLWSGESFAYSGKHYQVKASQFLPGPQQSPRIPIWIAGNWPNRPPFRRAARWDGMIPQLLSNEPGELKQLAEAVRFTRSIRASAASDRGAAPFDVVYSTGPAGGYARARSAELEQAGVTWWLQRLNPQFFGCDWLDEWPVVEMRKVIRNGPPK